MHPDNIDERADLENRDTAEILHFSEIPSVSCVHLQGFVGKPDRPDPSTDALCTDCFLEITLSEKENYAWKNKHFVESHTDALPYYCDECYAPVARIRPAEDCRVCSYIYARKLQQILTAGYTLNNYPERIVEPCD